VTLLDRVKEPRNIATLVVLFLGIVALFWRWFFAQNEHSWGNGDWSHAYVVPLISIYLLWQSRIELARMSFTIFWPGVIPIVMGIWSYVYFIAGVPNHFCQGLSLVLTVFGLTLLLLGPRAMEYLFTAVAFLIFGITVPEIIMNYLTYPLMDMAATGGFFILRLFNINADLAGNSITVINSVGQPVPMNVGEQCSGMRTVIAFLALGTAVALVGTSQWWKRVILIAMALPTAIVLNAIRIAVLGMLSLKNANFSQGEMHMFIGTVLLVPGFFFYLGILWALNTAVVEAAPAVAVAQRSSSKGAKK
jgi:exosortase